MNQELTTYNDSPLFQIGQEANQQAAQNAFAEYRQRLDPNTLERHKYDLTLFCLFLASKKGAVIEPADLLSMPQAWADITHGLVKEFVQWMLVEEYSIGSVNVRLSTVKSYFKRAGIAGVISRQELALIELVKGYNHAHGENVDEQRGKSRREGGKKAQPVHLSPEQITSLKRCPDTPQGRRDALLMCLLLDQGLRCGEVADLFPESIQISEGLMVFKREKVKKVQKHRLTAETLVAAIRYFEVCQPEEHLLTGSRKGKEGNALTGGMGRRAITKRVKTLGKRLLGIENLSAHDCRHAWVEAAIRGMTDIRSLQEAGGWSSPAMPLRYAGAADIANEGVKLG